MGHSCGGWILHTIAAQYSARIGGVAFLDGVEDPTLPLSAYATPWRNPAKMPKPIRKESPVEFPEAERRSTAERPLDAGIRNEILGHKERPQYERMRVPILAIFRTTTLQQVLEVSLPTTDEERAALFQLYGAMRGMLEKWESDLRSGAPHARIVELPGANLYMFLSNEADIIRELRMFAATLSVDVSKIPELGPDQVAHLRAVALSGQTPAWRWGRPTRPQSLARTAGRTIARHRKRCAPGSAVRDCRRSWAHHRRMACGGGIEVRQFQCTGLRGRRRRIDRCRVR